MKEKLRLKINLLLNDLKISEAKLDELKKSYSKLAQEKKKLIVENHNLKTQIKQKDDLINKLQDDLFIKGGRLYERSN